MTYQRPLDILNASKGQQVMVLCKGEKYFYTGILVAFDININLVLKDATFNQQSRSRKLGEVFVRGDNIVFVSPGAINSHSKKNDQ